MSQEYRRCILTYLNNILAEVNVLSEDLENS